MNWIPLNTITQLDDIQKSDSTIIIFKHSTRCAVSSMAKRNLEFDKDLLPNTAPIYYLDLIANRDISNKITEIWGVRHESPQILIVKGDTCIYNASHSDIEMQDIVDHIS